MRKKEILMYITGSDDLLKTCVIRSRENDKTRENMNIVSVRIDRAFIFRRLCYKERVKKKNPLPKEKNVIPSSL